MLFSTTQKKSPNKGFSLIEIMVAVSLFSVVMTISVGALLSLIDANRKAQALNSVINNLNFALENMSRNIRVGNTYHCDTSTSVPPNIDSTQDCSNGGVLFSFEGNRGDITDPTDQIVYRFINSRIEKSVDGGATFIAITASEVTIDDMKFYTVGTTRGDSSQPRVVMAIQGTAGINSKTITSF
ncbi:prepilin-type N-terminal cleavage/methylation domain-containing protein, partial [Candidatus Kaiserbacteria bacterium]|nr:prepilin-type N-terminal cleavage/methylation domain-containing protein [Candidatus Kaiserbacteria bacterium]